MSSFLRFAGEAVLVSTVIAGATRTAGLQIQTSKIENDPLRMMVKGYFQLGEYCLDTVIVQLEKYPDYFAKKK